MKKKNLGRLEILVQYKVQFIYDAKISSISIQSCYTIINADFGTLKLVFTYFSVAN